ncbi:hypothetical protein NPIL_446841 [Nephila pilipes]|uniref:Uncharacterized protein n=1 Tax=Nephila pilipes TaxID=299642 RepID=A0A8X6R182_NEPPI|nr:hypothetical protein NPIL_446841 [Nephila pilipes]
MFTAVAAPRQLFYGAWQMEVAVAQAYGGMEQAGDGGHTKAVLFFISATLRVVCQLHTYVSLFARRQRIMKISAVSSEFYGEVLRVCIAMVQRGQALSEQQ